MNNLVSELMVESIEDTVSFYTNILGFKTEIMDDTFASMTNGNVTIKMFRREEFVKDVPKFNGMGLGGTFVMYINVDNIEKLFNTLRNKVKVIQELRDTDYGVREFSIEDNNGYVLMFNQ